MPNCMTYDGNQTACGTANFSGLSDGYGCRWDAFGNKCLIEFFQVDLSALSCADVCFACATQNDCQTTGMSNNPQENCFWDAGAPGGGECRFAGQQFGDGPPCDDSCGGCRDLFSCEQSANLIVKRNESFQRDNKTWHGTNGTCYWIVDPFNPSEMWCDATNWTCITEPDFCRSQADCDLYNGTTANNSAGASYMWLNDSNECLIVGEESCVNGRDDNSNGLIDCADPNCRLEQSCVGSDDLFADEFNLFDLFSRDSFRINWDLVNQWDGGDGVGNAGISCAPSCGSGGDLQFPDAIWLRVCLMGPPDADDLVFDTPLTDPFEIGMCNSTVNGTPHNSSYYRFFTENTSNENRTIVDWFNANINDGGLGVSGFTGSDLDKIVLSIESKEFGQGPPIIIGTDPEDDYGVNKIYDIEGMAMKIGSSTMAIGLSMYDMHPDAANDTGPAMCWASTNSSGNYSASDGLPSGTPAQSPNYTVNYSTALWIDSDNNVSTGCNETVNGSAIVGFEYKLTKLNTFASDGELDQIRNFSKCVNTSGPYVFKPIDKSLRSFDGEGCGFSADIFMLDLADIGSPDATFRAVGAVTNKSYDDFNDSQDFINNSYYTPGTLDFTPVDCHENPFDCDTKFIQVGGGQYYPSEDCFAGFADVATDFDGDGKVGCADEDCSGYAQCYDNYDGDTDTTAPSILMMESRVFDDFAVFQVTTDEPTNGSLKYYGVDSTCSQLNTTIDEPVGNFAFQGALFRNFHHYDISPATGLLQPNSTYYYKIRLCDRAASARCALTSCLNFTMQDTLSGIADDLNISFNVSGMDIFLEVPGVGSVNASSGIYFNNSNQARGVNITFNKSNDANWGITFVEVDFSKGIRFDLGDSGFKDRPAPNLGQTVGMASDKFQVMAKNLGVDQIELRIPSDGDATILKCSDNGTNCSVLNSSYYDLVDVQSTYVEIRVPPSIAFSTYTASGTAITSDRDMYYCYPSCTAVFNVTITNSSLAGVFNVSINNTNLNTTTGTVTYNITYINVSDYAWYNVSTLNESTITNFTTKIYNESQVDNTTVRFNVTIQMSQPTTTQWNFTFGINDDQVVLYVVSNVSSINLTGPANNSLIALNGTFNFTLFASGDTTQECGLFINGARNGTTNATNEVGANVTAGVVNPGTYPWYVNCTSDTGEWGVSELRSAVFGNTAPTMSVSSPVNTTNTTLANLSVLFSYVDDDAATANCTLILDGVSNETDAAVANSTAAWLNTTEISQGAHTFFVACTDGNAQTNSSAVFVYTSDATVPNVTSIQTNATVVKSGTSVFVNVSAADNVALVTVLANTVSLTDVGGGLFQINTTGTALGCVSDGTCTVTANATDTTGNYNGSQTATFTVDDAAPNVTGVTNNISTTVDPSGQVQVNVTLADANTVSFVAANNVSLTAWNSTFWQANTTAAGLACASDGTCTVTINATDVANNKNGSESTTFAVLGPDVVAPSVTVLYPSNFSNLSSSSLSVNYSFTDVRSGTANCTLVINGTVNETDSSVSNNTLSWLNTTDVAEGNHAFFVVCTDNSSQTGSSGVYEITVDVTAPNVTNAGVNDSVAKSATGVIASALVQDASAIVAFLANGISMTSLGNGTYQVNTTGTALGCTTDGTCTVTFNATDASGNYNGSQTATYTIDDSAPNVTSVAINDTNTTIGREVNVTVSLVDANTISSVTANGNVSLTALNATFYVVNTTAAQLGCDGFSNCTISISAVDEAGNVNDSGSAWTLIQDTAAPIVSVSAPSNHTNTTNASLEVLFNFTDVRSASASCVLWVDGVANASNSSVVNSTLTNLSTPMEAGNFTFLVNCSDISGNAGLSGVYSITVDATAPYADDSSTNGTVVRSATAVNLTVNASDSVMLSSVLANGLPMS
ncbi:MAG: hypothetical protein ABIH41_01625, partial [Nanoarchaeota archaeon]